MVIIFVFILVTKIALLYSSICKYESDNADPQEI